MGDLEEQRDPYHDVKAEVQRELQAAAMLQAAVYAGRPGAMLDLHERLSGVEEELEALEAAVRSMVQEPARFALEPTAAHQRQLEVETLRHRVSDMRSASESFYKDAASSREQGSTGAYASAGLQNGGVAASSSSFGGDSAHGFTEIELTSPQAANGHAHASSSGGFARAGAQPIKHPAAKANGSGPWQQRDQHNHRDQWQPAAAAAGASGGGGDDGWRSLGFEQQVQAVMEEQDTALDEISIRVEGIKHAGQLMHEELGEQELLLADVEQHTDATNMRLRGMRRRVNDILKRTRQDRSLTLIVILSFILVILTVFALA